MADPRGDYATYASRVGNEWLQIALDQLEGVEPYEVMQALDSPRRLPVPGQAHGIKVLGILARTSAGRPLLVAVHLAGGFKQEVIGAREMTPEELARFEQWEAER